MSWAPHDGTAVLGLLHKGGRHAAPRRVHIGTMWQEVIKTCTSDRGGGGEGGGWGCGCGDGRGQIDDAGLPTTNKQTMPVIPQACTSRPQPNKKEKIKRKTLVRGAAGLGSVGLSVQPFTRPRPIPAPGTGPAGSARRHKAAQPSNRSPPMRRLVRVTQHITFPPV